MAANALNLLGCGKAGRSVAAKTEVWVENATPTDGTVYDTYLSGLSGGANSKNTLGWTRTKTVGNSSTDSRMIYSSTYDVWYGESASSAAYRTSAYDIPLINSDGIEYKARWYYHGTKSSNGASSNFGVYISDNSSFATTYLMTYYLDNATTNRQRYVVVDGVTVYSSVLTAGTKSSDWTITVEPDGDYSVYDGATLLASGNVTWRAQYLRTYAYTETGSNVRMDSISTDAWRNGWSNERISAWI